MGNAHELDELRSSTEDQHIFVVRWTDYVANDWVESVVGPYEATDEALRNLASDGEDRFGMKHLVVSGSIGSEKFEALRAEATPIAAFLALDWGLDPVDTSLIPGWPCQCGHYRHDSGDGFCSGTLGSMLDTDGLRPEDDRSTPCVCTQYVAVDADWARGVGFTF